MYDVTALGEMLVDFSPKEESNHKIIYEANPGGAPCNVLSMLVKMGKTAAFIGKVGDDIFGRQLKDTLSDIGINQDGIMTDSKINTTLAFVSIDESGDRDFAFYRNPGADMMLSADEVNIDIIKNSKIFHFGTISMTHELCREATKLAINEAKKNSKIISFDPNLRPPLWESLKNAQEQMIYGCSVCDILKIENEELYFLTGCNTIDDGVRYLKSKFDIKLILVTLGADGSKAYFNDISVFKSAFLSDKTIDTTGAGDAFCACCLSYILENGLDNLDLCGLENMLTFASAAASIVTTRKGAIMSMPGREEVEELISKEI